MKRQYNDVTQPRFMDLLPEIIIQVIGWFDIQTIVTLTQTSKTCCTFLLTHVDLYAPVYDIIKKTNTKRKGGTGFKDPFNLWYPQQQKLQDFSVSTQVNMWYKLHYKAKLARAFTQDDETIRFNTCALGLLKLLRFNICTIGDISVTFYEYFIGGTPVEDDNTLPFYQLIYFEPQIRHSPRFLIKYDSTTFDLTYICSSDDGKIFDDAIINKHKNEMSIIFVSPMLYDRMMEQGPDGADTVKLRLARQLKWLHMGYYTTRNDKAHDIKNELYQFFKKYIIDDDTLPLTLDDDSDD